MIMNTYANLNLFSLSLVWIPFHQCHNTMWKLYLETESQTCRYCEFMPYP